MSIYRQLLGADFARLHPRIQERFGFDSGSGVACIGRGVMHHVWHGRGVVRPFLKLGTMRNIMFPEDGENVPFQIANYAFRDQRGREMVSWVRTFDFPKGARRFDAYMALSAEGDRVVDYFGTHGHYSTDLHLSVAANGGVAIVSGAHRFHVGRAVLPFSEYLAARANVVEWYDDDAGCYRISVKVANPVLGPVFGYEGSFQAEWVPAAEVPAHILPVRALPA